MSLFAPPEAATRLSVASRATVHELRQSNQLRALHTVIRDRDATAEDFVHHSGRIIRLLLEEALDLLPFEDCSVTTPVGQTYRGLRSPSKVCAVPVIRAGESMEAEFRALHPGVSIGKILIQRDTTTKLPHLYYSHLPDDIAERHVFLLEPMLATGGSALAAIDVLLRAGVPVSRIVLVNFLASPQGLDVLAREHPDMHIVTSSIEERLDENAFMIPGIGDFGDRYYGTVHQAPR